MTTIRTLIQSKFVQALALIAALGVTLSLTANQRPADAQDAGSPTAVAVVDIFEVISNSKSAEAVEQARGSRDAQRQEEGGAKNSELEKLRADLDLLGPGTPARRDKESELRKAMIEAQVWQQLVQAEEQGARTRELLGQYEAANAAVAAVAKDRGVDVVLFSGQLPDMARLAQAESQQIVALLQNRKVLYNGETTDLTQAVLARMNADFDAAN